MGHRSIFVRIIVGPTVAKDGKVVPITEILRGMFIAESLSTSVTTHYYTNLLYQHFYDYHRRNASNNISCKHENALNVIVKNICGNTFLAYDSLSQYNGRTWFSMH